MTSNNSGLEVHTFRNRKNRGPLSMVWLVNAGSCDFLYGNWLESGALCLKATVLLNLSFQDFISNWAWDVHRLTRVILHELILPILQHPIPKGDGRDELVWSHTPSGRFSMASAFQEVRRAQNYSVMHFQVWRSRIPLKISFFMGCLLLGKLPVTRALGRVEV